MDDLSRFQKVSSLARELMRHGQAQTMDEAVKMAMQQVDSGVVSQYVNVAPTQPEVVMPQSESIPEVAAHVQMPVIEGGVNPDIMRSVERLVSEQQTIISRLAGVVNGHTNQLQSLSNKLNGIIAEMTALKEEVNKMKESPVSVAARPKAQGQTVFKPEVASAAAPQQAASSQSSGGFTTGSGHARSGNYKPEDVSIEKFFYYGGGKK